MSLEGMHPIEGLDVRLDVALALVGEMLERECVPGEVEGMQGSTDSVQPLFETRIPFPDHGGLLVGETDPDLVVVHESVQQLLHRRLSLFRTRLPEKPGMHHHRHRIAGTDVVGKERKLASTMLLEEGVELGRLGPLVLHGRSSDELGAGRLALVDFWFRGGESGV